MPMETGDSSGSSIGFLFKATIAMVMMAAIIVLLVRASFHHSDNQAPTPTPTSTEAPLTTGSTPSP